MSDIPVLEVVQMGLRMCASSSVPGCEPDLESPEIKADVQRDADMQAVFMQCPIIPPLVANLHQQLHHGPIAASCDLQRKFLLAVMAKMFLAGWNAGRQEVMDAEIKKLGTEAT